MEIRFYRHWQCMSYCSCVIIIPETLSFSTGWDNHGYLVHFQPKWTEPSFRPTWILYTSHNFAQNSEPASCIDSTIHFKFYWNETHNTIVSFFICLHSHLTKECVFFFKLMSIIFSLFSKHKWFHFQYLFAIVVCRTIVKRYRFAWNEEDNVFIGKNFDYW